jgi:PAS domain S-box-containing protein
MNKKKILPGQPDKDLRLLAEKKISEKTKRFPESVSGMSGLQIESLLHELNVYQEELKIQNEELRRTEAELDASRLRYFDLYDLAPVAYLTLSEEGQIREANLQASSLLGEERGSLLNRYFSNFILKEDLNIYYQYRKQLLNTFTPLYYEIRMIKKSGQYFWANLELTAIRDQDGKVEFRLVIIDISESKQHVEKEREIFLNLSTDMVAISDKNGYFKEINQAFEKTTGFSKEELISRPSIEFTHPDDTAAILAAVEELSHGSPTVSFTGRFKCRDGRYKWLEWSMTPVREIRYSICRDITERIKTGEKMEIALKKEIEINHLKSKFVSIVSHQFKTPLTVIQSNFELLNMYEGMINDSFKDKFRIISERVSKETRKLNALLNDVLSLSVINSGKPRVTILETDLIALVREAASDVENIQTDGRVLDLDIPFSGKKINTDPKLISHILINLLTNAFKFSKGSKNPILRVRMADDKIIIEITDFGIGIPAGDLKNVSGAFFRAKNAEDIEGTGLGLNIAREYLELVNGSLLIESTEKKFTTVKISLQVS